MTSFDAITLEVAGLAAAERFYANAFGLGSRLRLRESQEPATGFRGFTLSLTVAQPADVDVLIGGAIDAGATVLKPAAKSMWGYGGVVQAPDGTIWKVATSAKKNTGPATGEIEDVVLLLGATDIVASKQCYLDQGFTVEKSFGRMYVQFASSGAVKLGLYRRRALAKDAGVSPEGSGSHRIVMSGPGQFVDPDGFAWASGQTAGQLGA
ncbi:glyoxalase [Lentzea sp. BCCO 10_0061]|uniref:Glyoxalase n=1 Tax=Lentzea sokolovensis TaxID=3095429 RepID=A0ABU4URT2_9PSEU|nr:glyoxalase [Lentzea sp. BCCO 10_0061]MDX8142131.1 glyoxalase [Lentzea sp. BCCO 10_0061]